jgi:tetratricopeptide (TPR) repeat protein
LIGHKYLRDRQPKVALDHFLSILKPPASLSEANHLLANQSDVYYWIGIAQNELGNTKNAVEWWRKAARSTGDFQQMAVREVSDMSYWSGLAERQLGNLAAAEKIFSDIYIYSCELEASKVEIDYFASSLPTMLTFEEDLQRRTKIDSLFLRAQALAGLNRSLEAEEFLERTLKLDPNHAGAMDFREQLVPLVTGAS